MKVIFLDFDGVLNSNRYFIDSNQVSPFFLEDEKMTLLKQIIDETNAKIVISSSWREVLDLDLPVKQQLLDFFKKHDLEIYGKTNIVEYNRVLEIKDWLDHHDVSNYCILDDITGPWYDLSNHVVITNKTYDGMTDDDVKEAIDILKSK